MPQGSFKMSEALTNFGATITSVGAMVTSVQGAFDVFANPDSTGLERLGAVVGVLTTIVSTFNTV
jgi:hypothetical protein